VDSGSRAAFTEFVHARGPALQRTAYLLTGDWALAEDLVQTALARSYPRWSRIEAADPEAYVRRALVNTYASWWRRRWRGEVPHGELPDLATGDRWADVDSRAALHAALGRLPRRMRAVVVLRYHEDLPETEVARLLGISVGTVKSQCAKALGKLRADAGLAGYEPAAKEA